MPEPGASPLVKAKINGLALDVSSNSPVVVLAPEDEDLILPIWIGHFEAWAIAMELSGVTSKRPLTHDLLNGTIRDLGATVDQIQVTDLKEQTFYAKIVLARNGDRIEIDARPSDSIALALKAKAPIFVRHDLFQKRPPGSEQADKYDPEALKERLRNLNPEDFGKYSL
ncbi:MAG: bifunctional nuclease family protein [candidate division Zixibacteria bacterium]|nr:bifunctional nuclease family protein [candidate division Zixibacteria bacterium]